MKGRNFPKSTKRHAKTLLFSGFFAVFVSRETDAENQTVTRETYNFNAHHSPVDSTFSLEFHLLIHHRLCSKSICKNRHFLSVLTLKLSYVNTENCTTLKPFYTALAILILLLVSSKHRPPETSHTPLKEQYTNHIKRCRLFVAIIVLSLSTFSDFPKITKPLFCYCLVVL